MSNFRECPKCGKKTEILMVHQESEEGAFVKLIICGNCGFTQEFEKYMEIREIMKIWNKLKRKGGY